MSEQGCHDDPLSSCAQFPSIISLAALSENTNVTGAEEGTGRNNHMRNHEDGFERQELAEDGSDEPAGAGVGEDANPFGRNTFGSE